MALELGALIIHAGFADPMPWEGEPDNGYTLRMIARAGRGTGLEAPRTDVAPAAAVVVPDKSPRVTAQKVQSTAPYGPRLVWCGYVDGEPVARNKGTRRDALATALRTLTIRDWHAAQLESTR